MTDPYSTLGVSKGADEKAIKSAYRKLAKELHPDKNKDNPKASEKFSDATRAYDLLSDKDKRARYDRGEIDGEGNPANPFAGMGAGGPRGFGRGYPGAGAGGVAADVAAASRPDTSASKRSSSASRPVCSGVGSEIIGGTLPRRSL